MSKATVTQYRRPRHRRNLDRLGFSGWFTLASLGCAFGAIAWVTVGAPTVGL
ncbi:MAG: hypothetical protein U5O16_01110 [Rhodococcus sp. (in: high G+C Gram-positive bacteria)]|uniref:hypothetical protein n=1 Tax=Rhodococcus sp. TaxID=1831 RepID=UPI002AD75B3A|nr:hypothetical protein [Rhodococcus sp. (in: high G+C Gram-positive bacteria)]